MTTRIAQRWIGPAAVFTAAAFMLALTWRTWPDAIYDFGSQLYYPWRLSQGQHLYTDIAYFNGPLSQWFNTIAFQIFGVGLTTLIAVNLAITAAVAAVLWRLTSVVGVLVFILVFAFGQYVSIGNYNWVCPYTHEVTHGIALSLAAILIARRPSQARTAAAGFLIGLVFLTKAEVFVPAIAAVGVGLLMDRSGRRNLWLAIVAAAIPPLIAFAVLDHQSGPTTALRGVLGSWLWIFDKRVSSLAFYRQGLGVDDITGNTIRMLAAGAVELSAFAVILFAGIGPKRWRTAGVVAALLIGAGILIFWEHVIDTARPWPVLIGALAIVRLGLLFRSPLPVLRERVRVRVISDAQHEISKKPSPQPARGQSPNPLVSPGVAGEGAGRAMLTIFALGLLGKMLLNARIAQYGFALAMPAGVVLADAALVTIPRWIKARGGDPKRARIAAGTILFAVVAVHIYITSLFVGTESTSVGTGPDQYRADPRGAEINFVLNQLTAIDPHGKTVAVFPQGLMLNYLSRRPDTIAVVNLMPPEVLSTGEPAVLAMLQKSPPDAIILSAKDIADGGFLLSEGHYIYAKPVLAWVLEHYVRRTDADPRSQLKLTIWTRK